METGRWDDQCPLLQALADAPPPKGGAEETKGGNSGRLTVEAGAPPTWGSLALTYQGPCSLRLSDSLTRAAWPVSQIWNGCADLENTPPNLPQSCGKKPYAVLRLRIKKKKEENIFFFFWSRKPFPFWTQPFLLPSPAPNHVFSTNSGILGGFYEMERLYFSVFYHTLQFK